MAVGTIVAVSTAVWVSWAVAVATAVWVNWGVLLKVGVIVGEFVGLFVGEGVAVKNVMQEKSADISGPVASGETTPALEGIFGPKMTALVVQLGIST